MIPCAIKTSSTDEAYRPVGIVQIQLTERRSPRCTENTTCIWQAADEEILTTSHLAEVRDFINREIDRLIARENTTILDDEHLKVES